MYALHSAEHMLIMRPQQLPNLFALHLQLQLGQLLSMRHLVFLVGRVSCVFGLRGWNLEVWHLRCTSMSDFALLPQLESQQCLFLTQKSLLCGTLQGLRPGSLASPLLQLGMQKRLSLVHKQLFRLTQLRSVQKKGLCQSGHDASVEYHTLKDIYLVSTARTGLAQLGWTNDEGIH